MTHKCVSTLSIIASDNGLSPGGRQAIIWTSAGILLIGPLGTNFSEILIEIITYSFKKRAFKVSYAKWRPCCLGLNVLKVGRNMQSRLVICSSSLCMGPRHTHSLFETMRYSSGLCPNIVILLATSFTCIPFCKSVEGKQSSLFEQRWFYEVHTNVI